MEKKFGNVLFALFSVLLMAGSAFAVSSTTNVAVALNKAPVITGVAGPTSLSAGQAGTWKVSAYDPDGTYLAYSVNWGEGSETAPSAADHAGSTATFQHTYYSAGTYTITFTVKDSLGASTHSTITVSVAGSSENHPPAFTSVTCPATGQSVTCYVHASDPDSDPVTYTVGFGDSTPAVSGMQNVFAHTYQNAGTYTISVNAADSHGAETGIVLSVTLTGNENQKPVITEVAGPSSLSAGQAGTWKVSAYDPDGTYLAYSVNWGDTAAAAATKSADTGSSATFEHTYHNAGNYTIAFTVADNLGATAVSTLTVGVASGSPSPSGQLDLQVEQLTSDCYKYSGSNIACGPALDMKAYNGNAFIVAANGYEAERMLAVANPATADYLFLYKVPGNDYYDVATHFSMKKVGQFNVEELLSDTYKYENGALVTGVSLQFTAQSGYAIVATTPSGVKYETSRLLAVIDSQTAGFHHLFKLAGNDYFTTAARFYMAKASGNSGSGVTAVVGAVPSEVNQYDSVFVTGKVARGLGVSTDSPQAYRVVLSLDNGNSIAKEFASATGSVQSSVQDITLAPGESKEVSAYFTATQLGTNFAKIAVYQKTGNSYKLVASDSTKVKVDSGIPNPPNESVTISLQPGWNQISVPAASLQASDLAQKCDISPNVWSYNPSSGQYEKVAVMGGGSTGYWVKANAACTYTIDSPVETGTFGLKSGWNMIGSPLAATAISNFAGDCKITSGPWNYSPSAGQYAYSSKLEPGKGYWVKVASDCTLGSAGDMPPPAPAQATATASSTAQAVAQGTHSVEPAQSTSQHTKADVQAAKAVQPIKANETEAHADSED